MFPIGDDKIGHGSAPVVTIALVALNVFVFLLELNGGPQFVYDWAFIPARFTADPVGQAATIFSGMFMHGGWLHLAGNMLYLWIFGDNVEDAFGHARFLAFYLVCGVAATFAQYVFFPEGDLPNVGASGAIAGVLGAYLLMFPRARVRLLIFFIKVVSLPAAFVLGFWIFLQIFNGVGAIATTSQTHETGGIAYMAHVGGFMTGFLLALLLRDRDRSHET